MRIAISTKFLLAAFLPVSCVFATVVASHACPVGNLAVSAAVAVVAILLAGLLLSQSISSRIDQLIEAANAVSSGIPIRAFDKSGDELGRLTGALVRMSQQVIEQKAELSEASARLEAVLRASKDVSILAEDLDGRITLCNPGSERLLGYSQAELLMRNLGEIVHPRVHMKEHGSEVSALRKARQNATFDVPQEHENVYFRKDGQALYVQLSVTAIKDLQAKTVGYLHLASDITSRKVLESELRQKNETLKKQAQAQAASSEENSGALLRLRESAIEPLNTVQRSLLSLRQTLENENELQLVNLCRSSTETAIDAISRVAGRISSAETASSSGAALPELMRQETETESQASIPLHKIDDWYEEKGDIPTNIPAAAKPNKILIVDDFAPTRQLMNAYLKELNCVLEFAGDGEEGLAKIAAESYAVVLMDVEMPRLGGRETASRVRQWERAQGRKPMPIIAMTAHGEQEETPGEESPWTSYLQKPLSKGQLLREIGMYVKPELAGKMR